MPIGVIPTPGRRAGSEPASAGLPSTEFSGSDQSVTALITASVWEEPPGRHPASARSTPGTRQARDDEHRFQSDISVRHEGVSALEVAMMEGRHTNDVRCALPLAMAPRHQRDLLNRLRQAPGVTLTAVVDAPTAVFAHDISTGLASPPSADGSDAGASKLHCSVAGEPDGSLSVVVADMTQHRLLAIGSVRVGSPTVSARELDNDQQVMDRIRAIIASTGPALLTSRRFRSSIDPEVRLQWRWAEVAPSVRSVVGHGLNGHQNHVLNEVFGPQIFSGHTTTGSDAALLGLQQLRLLNRWTTCWPTARIHLGEGWTRQPGPLVRGIEDHSPILKVRGGLLSFTDLAGNPLRLRAGSVAATAVAIPQRLGTRPRLRLIDDGRLLLLGPQGIPPLAMHLAWPIQGSGTSEVGVRAVVSAGLELVDPTFATPVTAS